MQSTTVATSFQVRAEAAPAGQDALRCWQRWRQVPLCVVCDAGMLSRSLAGKPVPNSYQPAAMSRREPGDGSGEVSILPR